MRRFRIILLVILVLALASPVFAQDTTAAKPTNWTYAGIGLGLAVALAAIGQSRVAGAACEGIARNPAAGGSVQTAMILGLAFIESLVLFMWVMIFLRAT